MKRVMPVIFSFLLILSLWIVGTGIRGLETLAASDEARNSTQDPASLDRRISMMEQRFYILESSMRRLEQQIAQRPSTIPDQQRPDVALLQAEIERLKAHIQTVECAVAKLDERTLAPNQRQAAREDSPYKDPCRLNPETPLRLPSRP